MSFEYQPKIVAFCCNWCAYAAADLAGVSRIQYPPNIRIIRIPCSGKLNPILLIKALQQGADGVMLCGCHPGTCHYLVGNYQARRRFAMLQRLVEFMGIDPRRLKLAWISAAEGIRFAQISKEFVQQIKSIGPFTQLRWEWAQS